MTERATPACAKCRVAKCWHPENPGDFPRFCSREIHRDLVERTARKGWTDPEMRAMNMACENLLKEGNDDRGFKWTRVEEVMVFARILGYERLGIAFCVGLFEEARVLSDILEKNRFEVVSVSCMAGGPRRAELRIEQSPHQSPVVCNPVMQAEVLNRECTELNLMVGLCVGHDILFIRNSDAPVSPLVVKDRIMANNPVGVLHSPYHRSRLLDWAGLDVAHEP